MGKIRRGGYVFLTWIGDHGRHVHVYKDGRPILKWDLNRKLAMEGKATVRLLARLDQLEKEGLI